MILMRVVLPAPLGPTSPTTSPPATARSTPLRAVTSASAALRISRRDNPVGRGKTFSTPSTSSIVGDHETRRRQLVEETRGVGLEIGDGNVGEGLLQAASDGAGVARPLER